MLSDVPRILNRIELSDPSAADQLLPLVYQELKRLAAAKLAREKPGQTLQATALVHDAYLRVVGSKTKQQWDSRAHFFAAVAESMRRILIDLARQKRTDRRGGGWRRCELSDSDRVTLPICDELLDLDEAIVRLAAVDREAAELVKLRVFAGLTIDEAATLQGISSRTAKRNWAYARAWLGRELAGHTLP